MEEVRAEYYAAMATNSTHLAVQKFNQQWQQAHEMSMKMVNMDQNTQAYLLETYGVNGKRKGFAATNPQIQGNPFAQTTATPMPINNNIGGSIFGGGANHSTPVAAGGGSIFGGASHTPPATGGGAIFGGSIFGGTQATPSPAATGGGGSVFGGSASNSGSIFGTTTSVPPSGSGGSIFGQSTASPTIPATGGSIFGGGAVGTAPVGGGGSIFGGGQATNPSAPSIFAQQNQLMQQQPQMATGNIFGQSQMAPQQQQTNANNIFGQPAVQSVTIAPQPPPNPFQNASPFGSGMPAGQPPLGGSVFGNLGQQANQAAESAFLTGQTGPPPQQVSTNVFGASPFGGQQQQQMGINNGTVAAGCYSRVEDLKAEMMEVYQSNAPFELGKIPNVPPTREMCF